MGKKIVSSGGVSTFSDVSIVSENRLTKIPKNFDKRTAALFGCAITTGFGIISNRVKIKNWSIYNHIRSRWDWFINLSICIFDVSISYYRSRFT